MIIMNVEKYKEMTAPCFRDEDPPCTSACPLGMDVRKFISKMKDGKVKAAYRVFRPKAVFPGIVSAICPEPCRSACTRTVKGKEPMRLKDLEAYCFEQSVQKPDRYRLARKEETVAVIGGGLSGLSCAFRLSSRGYHVTIFEQNETVGGGALSLMDPGKALEDIRREFSELDVCTFETGHPVDPERFEALTSGFSAVYIATGPDGADFGCTVKDYIKTNRPGVFAGGLLTGEKNQIEAMACGFNAAEYIELYFKLGADAVPDFELLGTKKPDERFYRLEYQEPASPARESSSPDTFDPEAEAGKCYECNCENCYQVCSLMQQIRKFPKKIASDTIGTLRPNKYQRPGVRMIMGCTFCGKCREVCPADIDMGLLFKMARRDYYEDESVPESFHEFWLQDMEFSLSEETSVLHTPSPSLPSGTVFFPGCQLAGTAPDIVEKAYAYVRSCEENASIYLGCCGIPAEWAGAEDKRKAASDQIRKIWEQLGHPVFLLACTACRRNLENYCPEIRTETLYSYMMRHEDALPAPVSPDQNKSFKLFDPCGAAGDDETRKAVRMLAEKAGIHPEDTGSLPGCCGFGGHIYPANPALQHSFAGEGAGADGKTLLTYCANCKDTFRKNDHESIHLLELFFGNAGDASSPTLGQRRDNRRMLKQKILSEEIMPYPYTPGLSFTEGALQKMQKCLITEEQVDEVLREDPSFTDADTGLFYANKRLGKITLWVVYQKNGASKTVTAVYKHRVEVQE